MRTPALIVSAVEGTKQKPLFTLRALMLITICLAAQPCLSVYAQAESPKIAVEALPSSLEIPPAGDVKAIIVLRNPTQANLRDIKLSFFKDTRVKIDVEPKLNEALSLAPNGELAWTLRLSSEDGSPISGTVHFPINYVEQKHGAAQGTPKVAYASIKVASREIAELADVKVETTLDALDQQHPGKVYLVITNKSNQSIKLSNVFAEGPSFIRFDKKELEEKKADKQKEKELIFLPHQTGLVAIGVEAADRVQPGKHLLIFTIQFELGDGIETQSASGTQSRNLIVKHEVNVGVLGESAMLTILAVPSFLFLPGFLIVVTWGLLWKMGLFKLKRDTGQFPLQFNPQPTNAEFWVVAITISILVIAIYMVINKDFLGTYGLRDIVRIWLCSVGILGFAGYTVILSCRNWYIRRRLPSPKDSPIDALEKNNRRGLGIMLRRADFKIITGNTEENLRGFLLEEIQNDGDSLWIAPSIIYELQPNVNEEDKNRIREETERRISAGNVQALADYLKQCRKQGMLTVEWEPEAQFNAPYEVKKTDVTGYLEPNFIIKEGGDLEGEE